MSSKDKKITVEQVKKGHVRITGLSQYMICSSRLLNDYNSVVKLGTDLSSKCVELKNQLKEQEKQSKEREEQFKEHEKLHEQDTDLVLDLAKYTTYTWLNEHRGSRKGSGRLADAMIIANAVRGMTIKQIQALPYPYKKGGKKRYAKDKVYDALSIKKPDDAQRINSLFEDFPEVFNGIGREDIFKWMQKKLNKRG